MHDTASLAATFTCTPVHTELGIGTTVNGRGVTPALQDQTPGGSR